MKELNEKVDKLMLAQHNDERAEFYAQLVPHLQIKAKSMQYMLQFMVKKYDQYTGEYLKMPCEQKMPCECVFSGKQEMAKTFYNLFIGCVHKMRGFTFKRSTLQTGSQPDAIAGLV